MPERPNIICFITDDTGPSMLGYGGGRVLTPNLDRLAGEGAVADRFYTSSPVCTPGRYSFLTGHHPQRCPMPEFQRTDEPYRLVWNTQLLADREKSVGHLLQSAGYRTGYVGKWHAGGSAPGQGALPTIDREGDPADPEVAGALEQRYQMLRERVRRAGFDEVNSLLWANPDNREIRSMRVHNLEWTAWGALQFLEQQSDAQPLFLYVATSTMHGPHHVNDGLAADPRITEAGLRDEHLPICGREMPARKTIATRLHDAELEVNHKTAGALWTDDVVGAVMNKLNDRGLSRNTVVVYSTDHNHERWGKATLYEGGVHTPFFMRYPGVIDAGRRTGALLQCIDLLPTLCELAGATVPGEVDVQGRSMLDVLTGRAEAIPGREDLFIDWGYTRGVVTQRHKYFAFRPPQRLIDAVKRDDQTDTLNHIGGPGSGAVLQQRGYPHYFDADQLYDLVADPDEQHNLANDPACADLLEQMRGRLRTHLAHSPAPFALDDPDPYLHSEAYRRKCADQPMTDPAEMEWFRTEAYTDLHW